MELHKITCWDIFHDFCHLLTDIFFNLFSGIPSKCAFKRLNMVGLSLKIDSDKVQ